jgi:hypothetical protein
MPPRESQQRKQILEEAIDLIKQIPTTLDRIHRYLTFASMVYNINGMMSRSCLRLAMQLAVKDDEKPENVVLQRKIIDLAHKIDADFAISLAKLADDDPVRVKAKKNIQKHLHLLKLKKQMAEF